MISPRVESWDPMARQFALFLLLTFGTPIGVIAAGQTHPILMTYPSGCKALAYEEYGAGKPIVLLGGGPGTNPAYMAPVAEMLAAAGRRVLLLDQRGTGRSGDAISCRERMNLAGAVADLEALRAYLRAAKLTIAGHSFGGMLAMAYAQEHPDNVAGLLLLDTGPMNHTDFRAESIAVRTRLTPTEQAALQTAKSSAQMNEIALPAYFADIGNTHRLQESLPPGEPLDNELVGELLGPDLHNLDVVEGMRKLKAPVTLVFGRSDPGFFVCAQIQKLQENAQLFVVEHAGHYPWLEQPAGTATALKAAASAIP
jgi:proline iminopeptidase